MYKRQEYDRNVGSLTASLKTFAGPLPQDVIDGVLYRKGVPEILVTNVPGYGALPSDVRKAMRAAARGTANEIEEYKVRQYSKGGIVKNVSNVTDEPDEMQSRVTGIPFNATSEAAQDIEDRELKAQMESLGLRKRYVVGGLVKVFTKQANKILNNYKKGKISVEELNDEFTVLYDLAREEKQKMFDDWLSRQDLYVFDEISKLDDKAKINMKDKSIEDFNYSLSLFKEEIEANPMIQKFNRENPEAKKIQELIDKTDNVFLDVWLKELSEDGNTKNLKFYNKGF